MRKWVVLTVLVVVAFGGCSIPNLQSPECSDASDGVKEFYSFHFGNDMHPSAENLKARQRFLTPELFSRLSTANASDMDYFTASETPPKTFKIAQCTAEGKDKADVHVQIYWREDPKVTQKEVHVEAVKVGEAWLVNKVSN
jgi:hypothetical protein